MQWYGAISLRFELLGCPGNYYIKNVPDLKLNKSAEKNVDKLFDILSIHNAIHVTIHLTCQTISLCDKWDADRGATSAIGNNYYSR